MERSVIIESIEEYLNEATNPSLASQLIIGDLIEFLLDDFYWFKENIPSATRELLVERINDIEGNNV